MYVFLFVLATKPKTNVVIDWKFITVGQTEADRTEFSLRTSYLLTCISLGSNVRS